MQIWQSWNYLIKVNHEIQWIYEVHLFWTAIIALSTARIVHPVSPLSLLQLIPLTFWFWTPWSTSLVHGQNLSLIFCYDNEKQCSWTLLDISRAFLEQKSYDAKSVIIDFFLRVIVGSLVELSKNIILLSAHDDDIWTRTVYVGLWLCCFPGQKIKLPNPCLPSRRNLHRRIFSAGIFKSALSDRIRHFLACKSTRSFNPLETCKYYEFTGRYVYWST